MKRLVGTTVALNVGDRGTFQSFVFVSEQEVLGRKSAIVFAETNNFAAPCTLEMEEINFLLVGLPRRRLYFPPTTPW